MPPWDLKETLEAAVLFPDVPQRLVRRLYKKWGGSPRYTLKHALNESQQLDMETSLGSARAKDLLRRAADREDISSRFIHVQPSKDYVRWTYAFPSRYIRNRIVDEAWEESHVAVTRLISSTSTATRVLRCQMLEGIAQRSFSVGTHVELGEAEQGGE